MDTVKVKNLKDEWLPYLSYGVVDLAGWEPHIPELRSQEEDLGCCIVSSPIYIFIPREKRRSWRLAM